MNHLTIIGNLTKDPSLRVTNEGIPVCSFTVAVNRRRTEGTDFFNVTTWRKLAEICGHSLTKGKKVGVIGSVMCNTFEGKDGQTRATMDVTADEVEFLSPKDKEKDQNGYIEVESNKLPWG